MLAIATLPFIWGLTRVEIANPLNGWFVRGDPVLEEYEAFTERFGSDEVIIVAVHAPGGILDPRIVERITVLDDSLASVPLIRSVVSIADAAGGARAGEAPGVDEVAAGLFTDPTTADRLVSPDGRTTLLYLEQDLLDNDAQRTVILAEVRGLLDRMLGDAGVEYHLAGTGVIFDAINSASLNDLVRVFPAAAIIATVLLLVAMRSVVRVLVALVAAGVSTVWAAGAFGLAGVPINLITTTVPTIVAVMSLAMAVHLLRGTAREAVESEGDGTVWEAGMSVTNIAVACLFTSLTSAAAFAALTVSDIRVLRELGLFASLGIMSSFVVSMLLCLPLASALARRFPMPERDRIGEWTAALGARIIRRRWWVVAVLGGLFVAALLGCLRLRIDTFSLGFLPERHAVTSDSVWLEEQYGFYTPLVLELSAPEAGFTDPDLLARLRDAERALDDHPDIDGSMSLPALLLRHPMSREPVIPQDAAAVRTMVELAREVIGDARVDRAVDHTFSTAYISARARMESAAELGRTVESAVRSVEESLGDDVHVRPVGYLPLYVRLTRYLATSFLKSLPLVVILNYALLAILMRSFKWAALGTPSNVLPIFLLLGGMGWFGVPLDVATVSIACIAFGILVDDTIHLLVHTRAGLQSGLSRREAMVEALRRGGSAVTWTTIILVGGFAAFLAAEVVPVHYFGSLLGATLLVGLACDLTLVTIVVTAGGDR